MLIATEGENLAVDDHLWIAHPSGTESELASTLAEVATVKDQFAKILGGVVHRRIEYPGTKHLTDGESDAEPEAEADVEAQPADEPAGA